MTDFATGTYLTDDARTQAEVKTAFTDSLGALREILGAGSGLGAELTIASGVAAPTYALHMVDTQSDAASDDLDTIAVGDFEPGAVIALVAANAARRVYLTTAGNVAHPCLLSATRPTRYMLVGSSWYCLEERILLDSLTGSAASYDFTKGIGSWADKFELDIVDLRPAAAGDDLWLRLRDGTFQSDAADYEHHVQSLDTSLSTYDAVASVGDAKVRLTINTGNASNAGASGELRLFNPGASSASNRLLGRLAWATSAGVLRGSDLVGHYNGAQNPVDGLQLLFSSGGTSIAAGRAELFGYRR